MAKRGRYRPPRNDAERMAEARSALGRLRDSLNVSIDNRVGETGRNTREAIERWEKVVAELKAKGIV